MNGFPAGGICQTDHLLKHLPVLAGIIGAAYVAAIGIKAGSVKIRDDNTQQY